MSRIVVGVDGSASADRALRWAVREGELRNAEIELLYGYTLRVHAVIAGMSDRDLAEARMDEIVERNRVVLDRVKWGATLVPLLGAPTGALLDVGGDAELIVVGSRGLEGFKELYLGSTSYRTAAHASVPVAVIRGAEETALLDGTRPIVVGVDGSRTGQRALRWALDEAGRREVNLTIVHAYYAPSKPSRSVLSPQDVELLRQRAHADAVALVDRALNDVKIHAKVNVERVVAAGSPAGVLLSRAGADRLLVVGTRGYGMLSRTLFGSVSHQLLHHADGPVVVVP